MISGSANFPRDKRKDVWTLPEKQLCERANEEQKEKTLTQVENPQLKSSGLNVVLYDRKR